MTLPGGKQVSLLVLLNVILGLLVTGGAGVTLLSDTFGSQRWISVIALTAGILQTVITTYVHEVTSSSGPTHP